MLSRSSVYALQATLHLAQQPDDESVSAAAMATATLAAWYEGAGRMMPS